MHIAADPSVDLLIDSREENARGGRTAARALTVTGTIRRGLDEPEKNTVRAVLCRRHPDLKDFFSDPSVEVIVVKINTLQLLNGITDSYFEEVSLRRKTVGKSTSSASIFPPGILISSGQMTQSLLR